MFLIQRKSLRNQKLPAEKQAISFVQQPSQTLYLKIEELPSFLAVQALLVNVPAQSVYSQTAGYACEGESYIPFQLEKGSSKAAMLCYNGEIKEEEIILPRLGVQVDSELMACSQVLLKFY